MSRQARATGGLTGLTPIPFNIYQPLGLRLAHGSAQKT